MARMPRFLISHQPTTYHIISRTALDDFQVDEAMQRGRAIDRPVLIGQPTVVEEYRQIIRVRKASAGLGRPVN